ncbi:bifunctional riboflavin kinase/FAD synthetase [Fodinicola feengrottensis]|uniref:Riboflavin biosynthesis protein n=1 Tax=Fodinicola feengrottensis TaxID=435914 RepID=A0ABN2H4T8_9ACTN
MQRWRGIEATPRGWGRSVVTIGVFDGVHRGHQQIINDAVRRAGDAGLASVLLTFDPHPAELVRPGSHPAVLTPPARKAELVAELGVDGMCVLPFTPELSRLEPSEFVHDILVDGLHAAQVVVGANFRYGHKAAGDVASLAHYGDRFGFTAAAVPLVASDGTTFSSTYIRACIAAGDVAAAAAALGRDHRVEGVVVRGDRRGRELGYPTANLEPVPHSAVPDDGIYAGRLVRGRGSKTVTTPAAISIGTNPTFDGHALSVEAFVLDFEEDLYGEHVGFEFVARLRGTERFESRKALVAAIDEDVRRTREILSV